MNYHRSFIITEVIELERERLQVAVKIVSVTHKEDASYYLIMFNVWNLLQLWKYKKRPQHILSREIYFIIWGNVAYIINNKTE